MKKLFILSLIMIPLYGHVGRVTVLEKSEEGKQIIFYADIHSQDSIAIPREIQEAQINCIISKIEKVLVAADQKTVFLYEGLEPVEEREKSITDNGFLLLGLTKFHHRFFGTQSFNLMLNIDNRNFMFNEIYNYFMFKELLVESKKSDNKELELFCLKELENTIYDSFKGAEETSLYNELYGILRFSFDKLQEAMKSILTQSEFINDIFVKINQDIQKFKEEPKIFELSKIGSIFVDLNILANILNNQDIKKYIVFAGMTHIDRVRFFLKKYFGYDEIYSTDSKLANVLEKTWDKCCLGYEEKV